MPLSCSGCFPRKQSAFSAVQQRYYSSVCAVLAAVWLDSECPAVLPEHRPDWSSCRLQNTSSVLATMLLRQCFNLEVTVARAASPVSEPEYPCCGTVLPNSCIELVEPVHAFFRLADNHFLLFKLVNPVNALFFQTSAPTSFRKHGE